MIGSDNPLNLLNPQGNKNMVKRQFLGGLNDVRGKAALHHLRQKADQVRQGGVVVIELRHDKKARIQESDLFEWAKQSGFRIRRTKINNTYEVEDVQLTLSRFADKVDQRGVADYEFDTNSLVTTGDLHNWAKSKNFAIDQIGPNKFRAGQNRQVA